MRLTMLVHKDEAKARIIEIARGIFSHFGFKKTTMEEIAFATRKGKSSIYYYFNSKEDIFKAVVEKEADELREHLQNSMSMVLDPIEKLKVYIIVRMNQLKERTNFYSALKSDYLSHLEFIEKIRKNYDQEEVRIVENILREGVENNEFNVDDPHLSSIAIVTAMKGLEIPLLLDDEKKNMNHRIEKMLDFLFYGIVRR